MTFTAEAPTRKKSSAKPRKSSKSRSVPPIRRVGLTDYGFMLARRIPVATYDVEQVMWFHPVTRMPVRVDQRRIPKLLR